MILWGPPGVGKTTLGATIFQRLATQPIFWYTFRPLLNDRVPSLLFALSHFLHQQGASNLWQLLLAAGGAIDDYQLALALLREDLATLQPHSPVLCFDEVDCLPASPYATAPVIRKFARVGTAALDWPASALRSRSLLDTCRLDRTPNSGALPTDPERADARRGAASLSTHRR